MAIFSGEKFSSIKVLNKLIPSPINLSLPLPHQNKRRPSLGAPISSPLALFVNTQIALTISIVFEDRLPLIAPTHDVIERTDKMYPPLSGHTYGTIVGKLQNSKKV